MRAKTIVENHLTVDPNASVDELVRACKLNWSSGIICSRNYWAPDTYYPQPTEVDLRVINFGSMMSRDESIQALRAEKVRPATPREFLTFLAKHHDQGRQAPLATLRSLGGIYADRYLCVERCIGRHEGLVGASGRTLDFAVLSIDFFIDTQLLVVPETA